MHAMLLRLFSALALLCTTFALQAKPIADTLFAAYDDVLPQSLLKQIAEDCPKVNAWTSNTGDSFMHGKRATFWLPTSDPPATPRNSIEEAVLRLSKDALKDIYSHRAHEKIIGAEWWVQVRAGTETIGFHYDKDEAMASLHSTMKHPLVSTVTYLSDLGAPTLIFNQTTDGNNETPDIPEVGYISYPKPNRHITFSGDLQHGVLGSASKSGRGGAGRVTLLINWWEVMPLEPNTMVLTDAHMREIGIYHPESYTAADVDVCLNDHDSAEHADALASRVPVPVTRTPTSGRRHEVTIPPGDSIFAYLPKDLSSGAHELNWKCDEIYGNVGMLDLQQRNQVGQLFRLEEPKLLFLYDKAGAKGKKLHEDMLQVLLPLAKTYVGSLKVYFAPTDTAADVIGAFGLSRTQLPALVIDDTAKGEKHTQPPADFSTDAESVTEWLHSQLPGLRGTEHMHK